MRLSCSFLLLACTFAFVGCGDDDSGDTDTGIAIDTGTPMPDTGPPPMSRLFGACVEDSQCPGAGAFCRPSTDGFPGGSCTVSCTDRGPCDDGVIFNHCLMGESGGFCEARCQNGLDCRDGYTCVNDVPGGTGGRCVGVCTSDDDCGGGAQCNVWNGQCGPAGSAPTTGAVSGEACADESACRSGQCITEIQGGQPSGWVGGSCVGTCILPPGWNSNTLFAGTELPSASCPDAEVCFPGGALTQGSPGLCISACSSNADCRADEGYRCQQTWQLSGGPSTFTNGICVPIDCSSEACPSGLMCQTIMTSRGPSQVCAR